MNSNESIVITKQTTDSNMSGKIIQQEPVKMTEKSDIQQEIDRINSQYVFDCIGSTYGCSERTNGTQYCCKYYCPYQEIMHEI